MTLRYRLLLVYFIIVLLNVGTVGAALFELEHAGGIYPAWQQLTEITRTLTFLEKPLESGEDATFVQEVSGQYPKLNLASDYRNLDPIRESLNRLNQNAQSWMEADDPQLQAERRKRVQAALDEYTSRVRTELHDVDRQVQHQEARSQLLIVGVVCLTLLHAWAIGWLLKRWLLTPLEQLGRQVEALGRDEQPNEPLLEQPQELAHLARALDRARRSLGSLRQRLLDTERLTAIGEFATQLAHNLRNPLASIRANAQIASRQQTDHDDHQQRMHEIVRSVDQLNQWITGLMEVARNEPEPVRAEDIVPVLHRVRDTVAPQLAAREMTLCLDVPESGLVCMQDPATLEHALIAMLINAIEASPLGSEIALRATRVDENGKPPCCRISVEDQGSGLPAGEEDKIFESSYSTKQHGMGLGLALARQVIERQGGRTNAYNNASGGATVYVEVPLTNSTTKPS